MKAQYYQYSQYNYASQQVNPGSVSLSDYATAGFIYRRQDTSPDLKLKSFLFSVKYPLIAKNGGDRWSSIGVTMGEDQTGLGGILVSNELGVTYGLNFNVGKNQVLSLGTKINYQSRKVNTDALYTGSQYVSGSGFNPNNDSREDFSQFDTRFFSYSGGIIWQKEGKKGEIETHFGVSLFDINRPNESLFDGQSPLPSTLVLEGGYKVYENQQITIYPEFLYSYSTLTSALNIGAVTRYSLGYLNPRAEGAVVELHTKYLLNEGVMLGLQFVKEGVSIGMSYDIPLHNTVSHQGAFEIGTELSKLIESRYKARKRKKSRRVKRIKKRKRKKKFNKKDDPKKIIKQRQTKKSLTDISTEEIKNPKEDESIETNKTEGLNVTTTIGKLKHESLLLEPTKLIYYFDFDSSDARQEAKDYISDLVEILEQDQYIQINIVGHTDNVGTEAYNLTLSRKRAKVIVDQLIENNISGSRITSDGRGESEPLSNNTTTEKRSKNRRVEITLFY